MINICEIFNSIQGESTHAGMICTFIRLSGCNLSCTYCDTEYAFNEGTGYTIDQILKQVNTFHCPLVEVTGGEPLLQLETPILCKQLIDNAYRVLVETNGSFDVAVLPKECIKIMDIKCPDSGCNSFFNVENLKYLSRVDECKMVVSSKNDFLWAINFVHTHSLCEKCTVLFSPNTRCIKPKELAEWILKERLPVRLNLQLHKIIWGDNAKGV